jgi:hypothetical protein
VITSSRGVITEELPGAKLFHWRILYCTMLYSVLIIDGGCVESLII